MDARIGGIPIGRFVHEKSQFASQRFRLTGQCGNHDKWPIESDRRLADHQRIGGALKSHDRKAPLTPGSNTRLQLACGFFQAPFHANADASFRGLALCPLRSILASSALYRIVSLATARSSAPARQLARRQLSLL